MVVVGGPNRRPTNPRWRTAANLKKPLNAIFLQPCDRFWWDIDAYWALTADRSIKFRIFENPRWQRPPSWKITKIAISPQRFDRFLRNLVRWCKMGLLTSPTVKKIRISQMQDGGRPPFWKPLNHHIFATICPILMKFGTMTHMGPYSGSTIKISNFWKSKMAAAAILKITKIAIYPQRFDRSLRNLLRWCKTGLLTAPTVKKLNFKNPRWCIAAIFKTVTSSYLCNLLTGFDKIWHSDAQ